MQWASRHTFSTMPQLSDFMHRDGLADCGAVCNKLSLKRHALRMNGCYLWVLSCALMLLHRKQLYAVILIPEWRRSWLASAGTTQH
jgi:hypothetical protein